jgi:hypothetical protein
MAQDEQGPPKLESQETIYLRVIYARCPATRYHLPYTRRMPATAMLVTLAHYFDPMEAQILRWLGNA